MDKCREAIVLWFTDWLRNLSKELNTLWLHSTVQPLANLLMKYTMRKVAAGWIAQLRAVHSVQQPMASTSYTFAGGLPIPLKYYRGLPRKPGKGQPFCHLSGSDRICYFWDSRIRIQILTLLQHYYLIILIIWSLTYAYFRSLVTDTFYILSNMVY